MQQEVAQEPVAQQAVPQEPAPDWSGRPICGPGQAAGRPWDAHPWPARSPVPQRRQRESPPPSSPPRRPAGAHVRLQRRRRSGIHQSQCPVPARRRCKSRHPRRERRCTRGPLHPDPRRGGRRNNREQPHRDLRDRFQDPARKPLPGWPRKTTAHWPPPALPLEPGRSPAPRVRSPQAWSPPPVLASSGRCQRQSRRRTGHRDEFAASQR